MSTHFLLMFGRQLGAAGSVVCGFRDAIDCSSGAQYTRTCVHPKGCGLHNSQAANMSTCSVEDSHKLQLADVDTTLNFACGLGHHKGLVL